MSNAAEKIEFLSNEELVKVVKKILDNRKKVGKLTKDQQELLKGAQTGSPVKIFLFLAKIGYDLEKWDKLWFPKAKICHLFAEPYRISFRYDQLKVIRGYFRDPHNMTHDNPATMTPWD